MIKKKLPLLIQKFLKLLSIKQKSAHNFSFKLFKVKTKKASAVADAFSEIEYNFKIRSF